MGQLLLSCELLTETAESVCDAQLGRDVLIPAVGPLNVHIYKTQYSCRLNTE